MKNCFIIKAEIPNGPACCHRFFGDKGGISRAHFKFQLKQMLVPEKLKSKNLFEQYVRRDESFGHYSSL